MHFSSSADVSSSSSSTPLCSSYHIEETFSKSNRKTAADVFTRRDRQQQAKNNVYELLSHLKSCSRKRDLQLGRRVHINVAESGNDSNMFVAAALINMYAKCASMVDARRVFDSIKGPDVVSWTALILGYAENGQGEAALDIFSNMKTTRGCAPDSVTYLAAIKACTSLAVLGRKRECLQRGSEIHAEVGWHVSHSVLNTLIDMYSKCGSMKDARSLFDSIQNPDVVSWNSLILGYADNGNGEVSLDIFSRMKSSSGYVPNSLTYVAALKACTLLAADHDEAGKRECLKRGREIHSEVGHHMNHFVQNALINLYSKCGSMIEARLFFESIVVRNVVSWTALILGYADNGENQAALDFFSRMKTGGECAPDSMTYVAALKAACSIGALASGREFHSEIINFDVQVVTCLVDFYAKCGSMVEAHAVFDSHWKARNISTWTALIRGYGSFGDTLTVFYLFEAMQDQGCWPDAVTFLCMLSCCSHAGLIEKARQFLGVMTLQYGVSPTVMHYNCMIDILGRANRLDEALSVLRKMPCNPDEVTWMALLGVCRKWNNVEIGRLAFQSLVDLDENNAAAYVLMAGIYRTRGMWEEQERILKTRRRIGACKVEQTYVIDRQGRTVKFVVGKEDSLEIKDKMKQFLESMKEYVTESGSINCTDCGHSEKHAVVYGILNTPPDEPVRIFKDMKICDGCHSVTKIFSKLCQRVIIVREESRFHVMENGTCSCGEYW